MKWVLGKLLLWFTNGLSWVILLLIALIETLLNLVTAIGMGFFSLLTMGGCLLMLLLPYLLVVLFPLLILLLLFFVVVPILGTSFVSMLKYWHYIITEYLYDLSDYLMGGQTVYKSFSEYSRVYRQKETDRQRREQEEQRRRTQEMWEERFRQWAEYQQYQTGRTYSGWQTGSQGYGYDQRSYRNPMDEFKEKYEQNCSILQIPSNADKYAIKLAYRKLAKQYHPDINPSADATRKFQDIQQAYEFLSDENIERYKNMVSKQ